MYKIKDLSLEDKPREKLLLHGSSTLSNAELLAILIGSGNRELNAVDLCRLLLTDHNNNLDDLARSSIEDLTKYKGIGEAKAISIVSALEISRRRKSSDTIIKPKISCSNDAYKILHQKLMDLSHEEFWLICLSRSNEIIKMIQISIGGLTTTSADPKKIFKLALDNKAATILIAHNHPSGTNQPSQSDINLTKKIKAGAELLEIPLVDHIIYCGNRYFSFSDEGLI